MVKLCLMVVTTLGSGGALSCQAMLPAAASASDLYQSILAPCWYVLADSSVQNLKLQRWAFH